MYGAQKGERCISARRGGDGFGGLGEVEDMSAPRRWRDCDHNLVQMALTTAKPAAVGDGEGAARGSRRSQRSR
jgi:hypothetical protein